MTALNLDLTKAVSFDTSYYDSIRESEQDYEDFEAASIAAETERDKKRAQKIAKHAELALDQIYRNYDLDSVPSSEYNSLCKKLRDALDIADVATRSCGIQTAQIAKAEKLLNAAGEHYEKLLGRKPWWAPLK